MATYDNLPVYKKTYDLLLQLFRLGQNMERDYRYTIGENLKKEVIELLMNVYRANCRSERTDLIEAAREHTEVLRLLLRLLHDLKQISVKELAQANENIEDISRQLLYWQRSCTKKSTELVSHGESRQGHLVFAESAS